MGLKRFIIISIVLCVSLIFIISVNFSRVSADLADGLVAFYPFNGNANDESGNGNHGIVNGATLTTDRCSNLNSAYHFNGDDYIDIGNNSVNIAGDFTISIWIKVDDPQGNPYPQQAFIGKMGAGDPDNQYLIEIWDNVLGVWIFQYHLLVYPFNWPPDEWCHVVVTYDATTTTARVYFDGSLIKEEIIGNSPFQCGVKASIGATPWDSTARYLFGCLDEIRIYNRVLSETEIQKLSNDICGIPAAIDIDPDTLNIKSKGKWITCYIELQDGYNASDIDVSSIELTIDNHSIRAELSPTEIGDYDNDDISDLMVKFDRQSVQDVVSAGSVEMIVNGTLTDRTQFEGSDIVLVIDKGQQHTNEADHSSVEY